jgi:NAD-dependent dihydropyrimidine dehydrogenase PreA subunit
MKRKIINISEERCTGCGQCIPDCPEGALQLIDGKARLVSDLFCDGLGACIGTCPEGAISVVEREAVPYDEQAVMETISRQGRAVIRAHLEHLLGHGQRDLYNQAIEYLIEQSIMIPDHDNSVCLTHTHSWGNPPGECPGAAGQRIVRSRPVTGITEAERSTGSELRQWPVQLRLQNAQAPYFDNADLLISADCVPFAFADFHQDFLRDRILMIFCPKLDRDIDEYTAKLTDIFSCHTIRSITVLRMEVPCCSGVTSVVNQALERSGTKTPVTERTITTEGNLWPD